MTAEIMIMNKLAVALAADSALTIAGSKVYHSANKLFQLVQSEPVGFMVYGQDEFMDIPWETVVGLYRSASEEKHLDHLSDYTDDFIEFLRQLPQLSPGDDLRCVMKSVNSLMREMADDVFVRQGNGNGEDDGQVLADRLESRLQEMDGYSIETELPAGFEQALLQQCEPGIRDAVYQRFGELSGIERLLPEFQRLVVGNLLRGRLLSDSGIVFAGFGRLDVLPAVVDSRILFRMNGEIGFTPVVKVPMSLAFGAHIRPFAQTGMVSTFMEGIDPALMWHMYQSMISRFAKMSFMAMQQLDIHDENAEQVLYDISHTLVEDYVAEMEAYRNENYVNPVLDAVQALGKPELAAMAETLVNLTAFKRRVSFETESVGGDIDVAVISKKDGFVWVKRKKYAPE